MVNLGGWEIAMRQCLSGCPWKDARVERGISAFLPYHFRGWIPLAVSSKMCRRPLPTRPKFDELATASRLSKNGEYFTAQPLYPCVR